MRFILWTTIATLALAVCVSGQTQEERVKIRYGETFVIGEIVSHNEIDITLKKPDGGTLIIRKDRIRRISAGRSDVTSNYLSAKRIQELTVERKQAVRAGILIAIAFVVLLRASMLAVGGEFGEGGDGGAVPPPGDGV